MKSRDEILARVRRNQPQPRPLPDVPTFDRPVASLLESFKAAVLRMGAKVADVPADGNPDMVVRSLFPDARVICSATPEVTGTRPLAVSTPADLHDVDVGVVRALYGVAETGSVWVTERELGINALAFLSQHLVVLLDPNALVLNLHHAYRRRSDFDARYGAFLTGPSATADIEGILIHGAQGIRTLTIALCPPR